MNFRLAALAPIAPLVLFGLRHGVHRETQNVALDTQTAAGEALAQADCILKTSVVIDKRDVPGAPDAAQH